MKPLYLLIQNVAISLIIVLVGPITENNGRLNVEPSNFQDILVMIFLNDSDR